MVAVARAARVTVKDRPLSDTVGFTYTALRSKAEREGEPFTHNDVPGFRVAANLKSIITGLFPEVQLLDTRARDAFEKPIYIALRAAGNAHCLSGHSMNPVWWVRRDYNDTLVVVQPIGVSSRERERQRLENKVTPHEAGEDRSPEPVEVRTLASQNDGRTTQTMTTAMLKQDKAVIDVLAVLKEVEQPLTALELTDALGLPRSHTRGQGRGTANSNVMHALEKLRDDGSIHRRVETMQERCLRGGLDPNGGVVAGRSGFLYSIHDPVPPRTVREAVPGVVTEMAYLKTNMRDLSQDTKDRDEKVLDVISASGYSTGTPVSVADIVGKLDWGRRKVEKAIRSLTRAGAIHADPRRKHINRLYLPYDVAFPNQKEKKSVTSTPVEAPKGDPVRISYDRMTPLERTVFRALRDATKPLTCKTLAAFTGYSASAISTALGKYPQYAEVVGFESASRLWVVKRAQPKASSTPAPTPAKAPAMTAPAAVTTTAPVPDGLALIEQGLDALRKTYATALTSPADYEAIVQERDALTAKVAKLQRALDAALQG